MRSVCDPLNGKLLDIASMGEAALKSHSKGNKHLSNMSLKEKAESSHRITSFYGSQTVKSETKPEPALHTDSLRVPPPPAQASTSQVKPSISAFVGKNEVLISEILWT